MLSTEMSTNGNQLAKRAKILAHLHAKRECARGQNTKVRTWNGQKGDTYMSTQLTDIIKGSTLSGIKNGRYKSGLPFLPRVSERDIRRDIDIKGAARRNGSQNLPAPQASSPDVIEGQIINKLETAHERGVDGFDGRMKQLKGMMSRHAGAFDTEPLETSIEGIIHDIEHESARHASTLTRLREEYEDADQHYRDFREKHGLKRPPNLAAGMVGALPVLILMMLIESAANMFFFSPGSEYGLLGGLFYALVISVLNVGGAALCGYAFFRWMNARNLFVRFAGLVMAFAFTAYLFALNIGAGFYRSAFVFYGGEGQTNLLQKTITDISTMNFTILDEFSLAMMVIGIALGALASAKGARIGDAYPGYQQVYAYRERYRQRFEDEADEIAEHLAQMRDEAFAQIEEFQEHARATIQPYREVGKEISDVMKRFDAFETHLENIGNKVLGAYREANKNVRSSKAPEYFRHTWHLPGKMFAFGEPNSRMVQLVGDSVLGEIMNEGRIQKALNTAKALRLRVLKAINNVEPLMVSRQNNIRQE